MKNIYIIRTVILIFIAIIHNTSVDARSGPLQVIEISNRTLHLLHQGRLV